jgi:hypothetical protein
MDGYQTDVEQRNTVPYYLCIIMNRDVYSVKLNGIKVNQVQ